MADTRSLNALEPEVVDYQGHQSGREGDGYQVLELIQCDAADGMILPDSPANISAKNGVIPNRAAVIWNEEVPLSAYLENAVEVPQAAAAPTANNAATGVPLPVEN